MPSTNDVDLEVHHVRLDKTIRLANPQQFMARERIGVEAAYPGDIVGLFDPGHFRIGDTVTQEGTFEFEGIPRFPPEHFALVRLDDVSKRKQLKKGLEQLSQEGALQLFRQKGMLDKDPVVGAVGQLQFEVLEARLDMEYSVKVSLTRLPYDRVRWVTGDEGEIAKLERGDLAILAEDRDGRTVVLIRDEWCEAHLASKHEKVKFASVEPR